MHGRWYVHAAMSVYIITSNNPDSSHFDYLNVWWNLNIKAIYIVVLIFNWFQPWDVLVNAAYVSVMGGYIKGQWYTLKHGILYTLKHPILDHITVPYTHITSFDV